VRFAPMEDVESFHAVPGHDHVVGDPAFPESLDGKADVGRVVFDQENVDGFAVGGHFYFAPFKMASQKLRPAALRWFFRTSTSLM